MLEKGVPGITKPRHSWRRETATMDVHCQEPRLASDLRRPQALPAGSDVRDKCRIHLIFSPLSHARLPPTTPVIAVTSPTAVIVDT